MNTGKYLFNDIFREICDTFGMDHTVFKQVPGCDAYRIRQYKTDTKPPFEVLGALITCILDRVTKIGDLYLNKGILFRLNYEIFSNKLFTEEIRAQIIEMDDTLAYLTYVLEKSYEFNSFHQLDGKFYPSGNDIRTPSIKISQAHQLFINNLFQDALAIYKELLNSPVIAELLYEDQLTMYSDLGLIYRMFGINQYDLSALNLSLSYHKKASELSYQAEDLYQYALMNKYMGVVYTFLFNLQDAEQNLKKAMQCFDIALGILPEKHEEYPKILINYGILYVYYSDIRNSRNYLYHSIAYFDRAIAYYANDPTNYYRALVCLNSSGAYCLLSELCNPSGNTDMAEQMAKQALNVFTVEDHPIQYAQCISNLGIAYSLRALYSDTAENCEKAIYYLKRSLTVFREEVDATAFLIAHENLARSYILLSSFHSQLEYLKQAADHIEECKKHFKALDHSVNNLKINLHYTEMLIDIADAKEDLHVLSMAEDTILDLLTITESMHYDVLSAELALNLARTYSVRFRLTKEEAYINKGLISVNQSLNTFTLQDYPLKYARSARLLAKLYALSGNDQKSREVYDHVLQVYTKDHYPEKHAQILEEMIPLIC